MDQRSLTLFLPTEASWLGPGGARHFLNHSDYCFIPLQSLPSFLPSPSPTPPLPTSSPPPTPLRHWKELHQTSSCSRAKCPSTTLNSPGYLKPLPPTSLIPLNSINFCSASSLLPFLSSTSSYIHTASLHQPASVSAVSHCRCFISEGSFSLISLTPPHRQDSLNTWRVQQSCTISKRHMNILLPSVAVPKHDAHSFYSATFAIWN